MNFNDMIEYLEEFSTLRPNWDSDGGNPISPQAIKVAREFLNSAVSRFGIELVDRSKLFVAPCSDGEVLIEWGSCNGEFELLIDIHLDGSLGYLFVRKEGDKEIEDDRENVELLEVLNLVGQVLGS